MAFVAAVISVGLIKSKGESGSEDYFLAGRGLKWWLIGFSLIAANISTEQFVGMSGSAAGSLGQLAFLDNRVREIYQVLESGGLLEDTVLIFTSDHGDLVGQHGIPEKWDTIFSDSIMKIPLLFHCPCRFHPRQTEAMTENIDVLPTLLELAGIDAPYGIQGKSLVPLLNGTEDTHKEYVFSEGGHEKELLGIKITPNEDRQLIIGYLKKSGGTGTGTGFAAQGEDDPYPRLQTGVQD